MFTTCICISTCIFFIMNIFMDKILVKSSCNQPVSARPEGGPGEARRTVYSRAPVAASCVEAHDVITGSTSIQTLLTLVNVYQSMCNDK